MRSICTAALLISTNALFACGNGTGDTYTPPRPLTEQEKELVSSSNTFAFDFFAQIVRDRPYENVFVSPLSVSMALGMAYNGARNDTAAAMAATLAYGEMDTAEVNAAYQSLAALLVGMDPDVTLEIANSVWYRKGLQVLAEFRDACRTYFGAEVQALDFDDPGAVETINGWVAQATHGAIDEIIEQIDAWAMMYLVNAVYFEGDWTARFDREETRSDTFHGASGDTGVMMMRTRTGQKIPYGPGRTYQAARLPYGHEHFAMTILVPRAGYSVDDLVAGLGEASWAEMQAAIHELDVPFYMPRFEIEYEAALEETLSALGMEEALDPDLADFSGIAGSLPGLHISRVVHKTHVKVNEDGTEAAAATSAGMVVVSIRETMRVDQPFVFVIHDTHSQSLLFMGRILDL